jgi:hypothetical protein
MMDSNRKEPKNQRQTKGGPLFYILFGNFGKNLRGKRGTLFLNSSGEKKVWFLIIT